MAQPQLISITDRYYVYRFVKAGDQLPIHSHPFAHDSVIIKGRVVWFTPSRREEVEAFHVITFPAGVPHGIEALTNGAMILQVNPSVVGAV